MTRHTALGIDNPPVSLSRKVLNSASLELSTVLGICLKDPSLGLSDETVTKMTVVFMLSLAKVQAKMLSETRYYLRQYSALERENITLRKQLLRLREANLSLLSQSTPALVQTTSSKSDLKLLKDQILQFRPVWIAGLGKSRLFKGEYSTNKELAKHLSSLNPHLNIETEYSTPGKFRIDIAVGTTVAIECKPRLVGKHTLYGLLGEVGLTKDRGVFKDILIVIYGEAKGELLKDLYQEVDISSVLVLGQVI